MPAGRAIEHERVVFTGASIASRAFEIGVAAAAVLLGAAAITQRGAPAVVLPGGPSELVVAVLGTAGIAVAGAFPLAFGQKLYLNLGSGIAFGLLLVLPPAQALAASFVGVLAGQAWRRFRGTRLTVPTMLFNQAQYLLTWSLVLMTRVRIETDIHGGAAPWAAIAAAGGVYLAVNSWLVSAWTSLRRRASAWDVYARFLREAGSGYAACLGVGVGLAVIARSSPAAILPLVAAIAGAQWLVVRMVSVQVRQVGSALDAVVEAAERSAFDAVEHSERVAWWAERLGRRLGVSETAAERIAMAGKLHDLGRIAAGLAIAEDGSANDLRPALASSEILKRIPGFEGMAGYLRSLGEWYDGSGVPEGAAGDTIPLASRIIAAAEAYDLALVSARAAGLPSAAGDSGRAAALDQIRRRAGTQFDPRIVSVLEDLVTAEPDGAAGAPDARGVLWQTAQQGRPVLAGTGGGGAAMSAAGWLPALLGKRSPGRPSPLMLSAESGADAELESDLLTRQELARRRIARELHTEIGTQLGGIEEALRGLQDVLSEQDGPKDARRLAASLVDRIHAMTLDLRPAILDEGLGRSLAWYTHRHTLRGGIPVALGVSGLDRFIPPVIETAAFRVVQEALTRLGSEADLITVRAVAHGRVLSLRVEERGRDGASAGVASGGAQAAATSLFELRDQVEQLGGSFTVIPVPRHGLRVEAHLPLS